MGTTSTKSHSRNAALKRAEQPEHDSGTSDSAEISPLFWHSASLLILAGAAVLRLYELGLKPFHHDEGVNGHFLTNLYRSGVYHYDPTNYHGPTLYYFSLITTKLNAFLFGADAGLSTVSVRLVPAFFGIATVWLILRLRREIGAIGALVAAALIAVSPGHVYISRYFIHEVHFVFFTLAIVVAALRYYQTTEPSYLMLASLSAALLFATKETAFISVAVLGLALATTVTYQKLVKSFAPELEEQPRPSKKKQKKRKLQRPAPMERFGGPQKVLLWSGLALALFLFINILFYSSFFKHWAGVKGALDSLQFWATTSTNDHTQAGFYGYFTWLMQEEAPLLMLGAIGALVAIIRRRNRFAIFAGAWAFGILIAYSLIPYKTPWLMLNFIVPLGIIGGYGINEIFSYGKYMVLRIAAVAVAVIALTIMTSQSVILNFKRYDDEKYPYVYAHTTREFLFLVQKVEELANRTGTAKQTGITITSPDYWPLPWYLRDYDHAGFVGRLAPTSEPIVIGKDTQESMFFRDEDVIAVDSLVSKLKNERDPLSRYLRSTLSPSTLELFEKYSPSNQPPGALKRAITGDLNVLLGGPVLYEQERFAQVSLREETKALLEQNPDGHELIRLNRMLVEDAFPNELAKNLRTMLGDQYQRIKSDLNPDGSYVLRPGVNLVIYARRDILR